MADLSQFQPLLPDERAMRPLLERAGELATAATRSASLGGTPLLAVLRPILRAMNSYYTNRIEGQHTRPSEIETALRAQYATDKVLARKQRIAVAHMQVEEEMEIALDGAAPKTLYAAAVVREIHKRFYEKLEENDRITEEGDTVIPGEYRLRDVTAGRHQAPPYHEVSGLLDGWASSYGAVPGNDAMLVGVACSHHRLAWIHPFRDGNGRTARLHSHLVLYAMGLTNGVWSPLRGLARTHEEYYARLNNADLPRRNDLDGRGALSQEGLVEFVEYFFSVCTDQVHFMREQIGIGRLKEHLATLLAHLQSHPWRIGSETSVVKPDVLEVLHYTAITGPIERARFIAMIGVGDRTGRRMLASLLDYGILQSASPRAPVGFALPYSALRFVFPRLWPEAESSDE